MRQLYTDKDLPFLHGSQLLPQHEQELERSVVPAGRAVWKKAGFVEGEC